MDKSELKMRYDPEIGIYVNQIHGEKLMDIFELVGSKTAKEIVKEIVKKAAIGEIRITFSR